MPGSDDVRPETAGVKLTYDDFVLFPDDGKRHELIDGEHYVTPSPNIRHQRISGRLYLLIGTWLEAHPVGELFYAPLDVVFSHFDVVEPDLLYMSNARAAEVVTAKHVAGVPELVIEIGSPGTRKRDETIKRRLYERMGVTEYWVVDPDLDAIRVYRRSAVGFDRPVELSAKAREVLTTCLLAGLEIPLARVFVQAHDPATSSRTRPSSP
ncbi:MAG: Uma2 family endonuclease [Acidobacteriota bacterium]|nr:Uma2 family endonuclease [Acidobacteriota bacterium]